MPDGLLTWREHGPRKLRITTFCGLVFGTLSADDAGFEDYLGAEVVGRMRRVLGTAGGVIGRFTQALPNNWKLYVENVRDTYHASLLHLFFTTFRITRLSQGGGVLVSDDGGSHASATLAPPRGDDDSAMTGMRSDKDELPAGRSQPARHASTSSATDIQLQILSVFPGFILQQIHNAWRCARSCRAASTRRT